MNNFDSETTILETFREGFTPEETYLLPNTEATRTLVDNILDEEKWTDTSGKAEPPPDFYCKEYKLMMEVMRIDDHGHKNRKGKTRNPTNERESFLQKELKDSGILDMFPNLKQTICIPDTKLPTVEDHNYRFYRDSFIRTIEKHKSSINLYRENHPDYKLIFFVLDESSAYSEVLNDTTALEPVYKGKSMMGKLHPFWSDEAFLKCISASDIDYLIWFTPFKHMCQDSGVIIPIPKTCIFDVKNAKFEMYHYDEKLMISTEI